MGFRLTALGAFSERSETRDHLQDRAYLPHERLPHAPLPPPPLLSSTPAYKQVRGYGGSLYFEDTVVTSWDTTTQKPQEVHEEGRSYLNCVSEYLTGETCEGQAKNDMGECRMVSLVFGRFVTGIGRRSESSHVQQRGMYATSFAGRACMTTLGVLCWLFLNV